MVVEVNGKATMTVAEIGKYLGLCRSSVHNLLATGKIPSQKVNRKWIVSRANVEKYLQGDSTPITQR